MEDPELLILTSLASGPKHGYALLQDIASFAGVTLGPGTLYGAISRLEERGLIEALPEASQRHVGIFIEPKIKKFGAEFFATGSCNVDCNSQLMDRLHERLVFRRGNVVVILYIWGDKDESGPDAELLFANMIYNRIP